MRKLLALLAVAAGLLVTTARPAAAIPCCSACDFNPRFCLHGCSPSCKEDEVTPPPSFVDDEATATCYLVD